MSAPRPVKIVYNPGGYTHTLYVYDDCARCGGPLESELHFAAFSYHPTCKLCIALDEKRPDGLTLREYIESLEAIIKKRKSK